jgi:CxxC-x17-CxxC domain-containing protein
MKKDAIEEKTEEVSEEELVEAQDETEDAEEETEEKEEESEEEETEEKSEEKEEMSFKREMHKAVCADCGKECEVPFKPIEGRSVYCRECYSKHRPQRRRF